jgi:hypothetical protein
LLFASLSLLKKSLSLGKSEISAPASIKVGDFLANFNWQLLPLRNTSFFKSLDFIASLGQGNTPLVDFPKAKNEPSYFEILPLSRLLAKLREISFGVSMVDAVADSLLNGRG